MQLPPPVHGASVVNQNIKNSSKIDSVFYCCFINISLADSLETLGKGSIIKLVKFIVLFFRVFYTLVTNKFDAVYITLSPHGGAFYKDSILLLLAKLFCSKRVIHLHGKGIKSEANSSKFKAKIYNIVFKNCNVIHLAQSLLCDIDFLLEVNKTYILPNGIPCISYKKINHQKQLPNLLYISNLVPAKGGLDFIKACKLLLDNGYEFEANLAGAHSSSEFLNKCKHYIDDNSLNEVVNLLGPIYGEEKENLLASADMFVLPTYFRNECFPLSILEAMSYGLPVISTEEGAIPDIINNFHNGLIIKRNSPVSLYSAISHLLDNGNIMEELARNARQDFLDRYTVEKFETNFIDIMLDIISQSGIQDYSNLN